MKILGFGEIMMRLSTAKGQRLSQAADFQTHYGGGEANVVVSLSKMGHQTRFITGLPTNDLGLTVQGELRKHNVDTESVIHNDGRLGLYFLETGSGHRNSKVIYDRSGSVFAEMDLSTVDFDKLLEGVKWFHWSGISPAVSEQAAKNTRQILEEVSRRDITISVDLNYREKLWKYGKSPSDIMPDLVKYAHVLVGNEGHNHIMLGIDPIKELGHTATEDLEAACQRIIDKFPNIHTVAISRRDNINASQNRLEASLYKGGSIAHSKAYDITDIVDRIGGGDAFMAGLIHGLISYGEDSQKTIDYAVAASVLKHSISGDFNLVAEQEVIQLMNGNSGHVAR